MSLLETLKERTGYSLPQRVAGVLEELVTQKIKDGNVELVDIATTLATAKDSSEQWQKAYEDLKEFTL